MKDLEQLSEERLMQITQQPDSSTIFMYEVRQLARIALATKQAKPVYQIETYSIDEEDKEVWSWNDVDYARYGKHNESHRRVIYTTPQPAHTENVIPDGWKLVPVIALPSQWAAGQKAHNISGINKVDAVYKAMVESAPDVYGFDPALAGSEATVITNYFTPDGYKLVPNELTPEMRDAWDSAPNGEDDDENMRAGYRQMLRAAPKPEAK
ncbi:hypothetical protein [Rahnella inusitata]|uniref:hypothetical protein n=1 Tax=Rahnella inusitata TaxID=58169 RepID=UPI001BC83EEF|nr:hypothetical protein [Rahnella inusitata]QUT13807.1 hypothetical protein I2123_13875 [Rahnella inusitata]